MTRRSVLRGAAVTFGAAVVGFVIARNSDAADTKTAGTGANGYGPSGGGSGSTLTTVGKVPSAGGLVLGGAGVVVTKDASGTIHAFSSTCTHQGCTVSQVSKGTIDCPCHGSQFDATTGAVVRGPAPSGLRPVAVVVRDAQVFPA